MKSRRLKIAAVSMHVVASWGKDIGDKIKESIPKGSKILKQRDNFETASLEVLIYNDDFEVAEEGREVPKINLDIKIKDDNPKIILPRH